jgi:hypothetical protein
MRQLPPHELASPEGADIIPVSSNHWPFFC